MTYIVAVATSQFGIVAADTAWRHYTWPEGATAPVAEPMEPGSKITALYPAWLGWAGSADLRQALTEELGPLDDDSLHDSMRRVPVNAAQILAGYEPRVREHVARGARGFLVRETAAGFRWDVLDVVTGAIIAQSSAAIASQPVGLSEREGGALLHQHLSGIEDISSWEDAAGRLERLFVDVGNRADPGVVNRMIEFGFVWRDTRDILYHHHFIAEVEG